MKTTTPVLVWAAMAAALLSPAIANAFCGAYVGAAGAELYNHASQIMLARSGNVTTLTLANDYQGELDEFALIIPVPEIVDASQVWTVGEDIFRRTDTYSSPRTVHYACREAITERHWPMAAGCGLLVGCGESDLGAYTDGDATGVTVEAQFQVSEYDIAILSATGADGLLLWLDDHGYALPEGGEEVFQYYIDAGTYFLAARIMLDALPEGKTWLSPLRFTYTSEVFSLPIRMGTISSTGVQDLLLYVMGDDASGEVGIANYPRLEIEDECMWPSDSTRSFGDYYDALLEEALAGGDRAGWLVEYSWYQPPPTYDEVWGRVDGQKCDPCVVQDDTPVLIQPTELGLNAPSGHFTRIHMRYRPEQVDQDLVFYFKGPSENGQMRYVEYKRELEFLFPLCGRGFADNPGECGDAWDPEAGPTVSCASAMPPVFSGAAFLVLLLVLRRRR
jgi:hypothetical protein